MQAAVGFIETLYALEGHQMDVFLTVFSRPITRRPLWCFGWEPADERKTMNLKSAIHIGGGCVAQRSQDYTHDQELSTITVVLRTTDKGHKTDLKEILLKNTICLILAKIITVLLIRTIQTF